MGGPGAAEDDDCVEARPCQQVEDLAQPRPVRRGVHGPPAGVVTLDRGEQTDLTLFETSHNPPLSRGAAGKSTATPGRTPLPMGFTRGDNDMDAGRVSAMLT